MAKIWKFLLFINVTKLLFIQIDYQKLHELQVFFLFASFWTNTWSKKSIVKFLFLWLMEVKP